jgi:hypothetical protein
VQLRKLQRAHRDYDRDALERNRDLFDGGDRFGRNVRRYLIKNDREPGPVYERRCELAKAEYINYCGPIGNYFASWLMTSKPTFKADPDDGGDAFEKWKEDCDGHGTDFDQFLRAAFVDALIDQRAWWRIEFPEKSGGETRSEWAERGLDMPILRRVPATAIVNWKRDDNGFAWIVEYERTCFLDDLDDEDETVRETWTQWRRDGQHRRWQCEHAARDKIPADYDVGEVEIPDVFAGVSGIPLVSLELPSELWLMGLLAAPQLAHWRKRVGLSWAIDRTCYAMPVFNLANKKGLSTVGTGYYLRLGPNDKASYLSPPADTYGVVESYLDKLKDEIHRVVQQMARGVDNNAAAVGRSGDSKRSDDRQTEIVLSGYGACVRAAAERTLDIWSEGRGERAVWHVGGMDNYNVTSASDFVNTAVAAQAIDVPSVTYHREIAKRVAKAQLNDLDEQKAQQIQDEIEAGVTEESIATRRSVPGIESSEDGTADHGVGGGGQPLSGSDAGFRQLGPP